MCPHLQYAVLRVHDTCDRGQRGLRSLPQQPWSIRTPTPPCDHSEIKCVHMHNFLANTISFFLSPTGLAPTCSLLIRRSRPTGNLGTRYHQSPCQVEFSVVRGGIGDNRLPHSGRLCSDNLYPDRAEPHAHVQQETLKYSSMQSNAKEHQCD